ncbi:MAG: regulatory protein RecX [Gammaproteobacteria bacterium]|nr:regulatory protein RecX [Gammaproteobacteria bacterium]
MSAIKTIKQKAIDLLARREHSRLELERKLLAKDFNLQEVSVVLDDLIAQNLQSDERFAESYIHSRSNKGFGPLKIAEELKQRGVNQTIYQQFLDEQDWHQLACQVRIKKFGKSLPSDFVLRAKQMNFLQYRGFAGEQIRAVMD